jgi:hypothetical protein
MSKGHREGPNAAQDIYGIGRCDERGTHYRSPAGNANQAFIPLQFSWQGPVPDVRMVRVVLSDGSSLYAKSGGNPWAVESCVQHSGPSILSEGPIQTLST